MITVNITQGKSCAITISCEDVNDIRKAIVETLKGIEEAGVSEEKHNCNKNLLLFPGQSFSVSGSDYVTCQKVVDGLCKDIDEYMAATVADLKCFFGLSYTSQDDSFGVRNKSDIVIERYYDGYKIIMNNLVEVK